MTTINDDSDRQRLWFVYANELRVFGFFNEYRWLSNFHEHSPEGYIPGDRPGTFFTNVESFYQSRKIMYANTELKVEDFYGKNGSQSKRLSRKIILTQNGKWNKDRFIFMESALKHKFRDPELRQRLLDTGDRVLYEANYWHDTTWGCDEQGLGNNILGNLIMKVRWEIRFDSILKSYEPG